MKWFFFVVFTISLFACDKIVRIQKVELVDVKCDSLAFILEEVYNVDQKVRTVNTDFKTLVRKDHENLEKVVSILEKCGMPTLNEVSQKQIDAIWLVLHHSPQEEYMEQYLPLLEKAAIRGDIKKGAFATIKDRVLLNDGQPQKYGTQICNGKLCELEAPTYVNQRRREVDLEPIEKYLQKFNIEFTVLQENK